MQLDAMSIEDAVALMNQQDAKAVQAVAAIRGDHRAIELVVAALKQGGRLIYFGAGTSGRLGVLDASECPPTFRVDPDMVQGVIAGGPDAMFRSKEGAEDSREGRAQAVDEKSVRRERRRSWHRLRRHHAFCPWSTSSRKATRCENHLPHLRSARPQ